ncbi:PREDICTED: cytochrome P450 71D9 [Theobroma cacao]|uniref:Cytochrome P450 71D9 n=1 Tax=Theobroma cacao TaxID=3641 RepID=A0AB32UYS6_THECC|nr:PREDICTED: cytochrome P450 71D9 [Theobroma cacao]
MENYLLYFLFLFTFTYFIFMALRTWMKPTANGPASRLPPGPPQLPLIGNLHLFKDTQAHLCLAQLAQKYGPVMRLQLGEVPTVVVSSPEGAKEVMKTHDSIFSERPYLYAAELITYNCKDIVFSRGQYLRQTRKICALELLSTKRVQSFRPIREEEISNLIRTISSKAGQAINLKYLLYSSALSIVSRSAFGGKCKFQEEFLKLIPDISDSLSGLCVVDLYPSIKLLHLINAMRPKNKRLHKKVDEILENIIHEHRVKKSTARVVEDEGAGDLVQVLLDIQDHGGLEVPLSTSSVKAIILNIFGAGGDTSSTVVEWAMSEMSRNPRIMKKAQAEVRGVFAGKRDVDEAGLHDLKYLNQVIKETLRFHPPAPLLLPRECRESCEVNGWVIQAKTRIIVNAWAIGRDENYWMEAEKFHPERFDDSSFNYKGTDFHYIPFGAGRRICPGISFAIANVELTLAKLLYHFDWQLPNGMKPEDLDMTGVFAATWRKRDDLCLVPVPYEFASSG